MRRLSILLSALLLAGCAATGDGSASPSPERRLDLRLEDLGLIRNGAVSRVPEFRIRGWQTVGDRALVLTAGRHEHYLVTFVTPCLGLETAFSIGLDGSIGGLRSSDAILVEGLHGRPERCRIFEIEALADLPRPQ
jgi:hypothetical protein